MCACVCVRVVPKSPFDLFLYYGLLLGDSGIFFLEQTTLSLCWCVSDSCFLVTVLGCDPPCWASDSRFLLTGLFCGVTVLGFSFSSFLISCGRENALFCNVSETVHLAL